MRRSRLIRVLLGVLLAITATSCGSDSDDAQVGAVSDPDRADEQAAEDALASVFENSECRFLSEFAGGFSGFDPSAAFASGQPVDMGDLFRPIAEEFSEVADAAPEAIADEFETLARAFSALVAELDGVVIDFASGDGPDEETLERLRTLEDTLSNEDMEAASDAIESWLAENCADFAEKFDLGDFGG